MESISEKETKLEVEQLLKLKRLEKPNDTYWEKFQKELHDKTLQTLLPRKPWYRRILEEASGRVQPLLPLSATAVLLFCFVVSNQMTVQIVEDPIVDSEMIAEVGDTDLGKATTAVLIAEESFKTELIELSEPSFVVAAFTAEPENQTDFTKVAVSKSMPKINSNNIHYIAGHFRGSFSGVASSNVIQ